METQDMRCKTSVLASLKFNLNLKHDLDLDLYDNLTAMLSLMDILKIKH